MRSALPADIKDVGVMQRARGGGVFAVAKVTKQLLQKARTRICGFAFAHLHGCKKWPRGPDGDGPSQGIPQGREGVRHVRPRATASAATWPSRCAPNSHTRSTAPCSARRRRAPSARLSRPRSRRSLRPTHTPPWTSAPQLSEVKLYWCPRSTCALRSDGHPHRGGRLASSRRLGQSANVIKFALLHGSTWVFRDQVRILVSIFERVY